MGFITMKSHHLGGCFLLFSKHCKQIQFFVVDQKYCIRGPTAAKHSCWWQSNLYWNQYTPMVVDSGCGSQQMRRFPNQPEQWEKNLVVYRIILPTRKEINYCPLCEFQKNVPVRWHRVFFLAHLVMKNLQYAQLSLGSSWLFSFGA